MQINDTHNLNTVNNPNQEIKPVTKSHYQYWLMILAVIIISDLVITIASRIIYKSSTATTQSSQADQAMMQYQSNAQLASAQSAREFFKNNPPSKTPMTDAQKKDTADFFKNNPSTTRTSSDMDQEIIEFKTLQTKGFELWNTLHASSK
jgi:type II secretory pathway pseudopilin PulG